MVLCQATNFLLITFCSHIGWWVCSVDLASNDEANENVIVNPNDTWVDQEKFVQNEVTKVLGGQGEKIEAVVNMAGKLSLKHFFLIF